MVNLNHGELDGRRILKEATHDVMWKPAHEIPGEDAGTEPGGIGISWFLGQYRGHLTVSHSGEDTGYVADLAMIPEKKIGIVWMTNCDWARTDTLTHAVLDIALGLKPQAIVMKRWFVRSTYLTFVNKGIDAALEQYQYLRKNKADLYDFREITLNGLGEYLLQEGYTKEAISVLELDVEAYPSSPRVYDSLAEAHIKTGNLKEAEAYYQKALARDATDQNAKDMLAKLKEAKEK